MHSEFDQLIATASVVWKDKKQEIKNPWLGNCVLQEWKSDLVVFQRHIKPSAPAVIKKQE